MIVFLTFLLSHVTIAAYPRLIRSPCPDVFHYEPVVFGGNPDWVFPSEDHRWRGVVRVPPALPAALKVKLLTPVALPSKYVGRIELAEDKNRIVKKLNSGALKELKYFIYFPANVPIPELILIELNSKILCAKPEAPRRIKTILTLEHTLTPIAANITLRGGIGNNRKISTEKVKDKVDERIKCGRSVFQNLTSGKPSISIGDWPWMVPLFRKTDLGLQFFCSSTLVSADFVVTAAHCLQTKNANRLKKESIIAYPGRFDITNWTEENAQPREIGEMFVHPDFDPFTLRSDLALLKFSKPVEMTPRVSPVCLWQGDDNLEAIAGKKGVVFGWGSDRLGHKITPTPKLAVMPIVSQEECLRSKMEFWFFTSNRTFCAGFRNGTGPCNGDSGGGLLMPIQENGELRWVLRGVVSLSLQNEEIMCDVQEYTVFTDVARYQSWIAKVMPVERF